MKKIMSVLLTGILGATLLASCSPTSGTTDPTSTEGFDTSKTIAVISRESGSGTRGAFVELTGVLVEDEDGNETDKTAQSAATYNSTQAVMTNVASNAAAIGYISLGSLNDTVSAIKVGGVAATTETVKDGSYKIARPFNVAYKDGTLSEQAQNFMEYIMSDEGQAIVAEEGYIDVDSTGAFAGATGEGKIVVAGSTSVAPLMEKLKEAYEALNSNVTIEIQATGSSSGMTAAIDGTCDIGMASRELKDSELAELKNEVISMDGIAVVVNNANTIEDLTIEQIGEIFRGDKTVWSDFE